MAVRAIVHSKIKKNIKIATTQPFNKKSHILLVLQCHVFMQSLMREVHMKARERRAKVVRRDHVRAVGKRMLRKFKP